MWINLVLARRPGQSTPTNEMQVSVKNTLASIGPGVEN
jgi:hypothetical protein